MPDRPRFDPARMKPRPGRTPNLFGSAAPTPSTEPPMASASGSSSLPPSDSPPIALTPDKRLSVSQLAALIERSLRDAIPTGLKVVGEISQFRERTHWYFDLKDSEALISCVMFASAARRAGFTPEPGQQVVVTGRVDFYAKQGRTTFMVDRIEPVGVGALELAFKKLCDDLRALGYFDEERKRPLPVLPRRIGVITSRTGAALQDVLDTISRRCPSVQVALFDTRVQGEGAAAEVARTISHASLHHERLGLDALLVTRGGGSREDLWAFNERVVADAILHAQLPVVAAIGHETDVTIAELVADARAATPTQAAMRLAPDAAALLRQLDAHAARLRTHSVRQIKLESARLAELRAGLRSASRSAVSHAQSRLASAVNALERHRPVAVYAQREAELRRVGAMLAAAASARLRSVEIQPLSERLREALARRVLHATERVDTLSRALDLVGPAGVLGRGFSLTLDADGRAIRSASAIAPGQRITTRVSDGSFDSIVGAQDGQSLPPLPLRSRPTPTVRRRPQAAADSPGLFGPSSERP